jgi:hypothetical protein
VIFIFHTRRIKFGGGCWLLHGLEKDFTGSMFLLLEALRGVYGFLSVDMDAVQSVVASMAP